MGKSEILWQASSSRKVRSHINNFINYVKTSNNLDFNSWNALYKWSITQNEEFWSIFADFAEIKWKKRGVKVKESLSHEKMMGVQWFSDSTLNFAENMLIDLSSISINSYSEQGLCQTLDGQGIYDQVKALAVNLRKNGFKKGDVAAGIVQNNSHAIIAMLAVASCGGLDKLFARFWSSSNN